MQKDVNDSNVKVEVAAKKAMEPVQRASQSSFEDFPQSEADAVALQKRRDVEVTVADQEDRLEIVLEEAPASPKTDKVANSLEDASIRRTRAMSRAPGRTWATPAPTSRR